MTILTSKQVQNGFGAMLDTVQREPVTITRRDRPVAIVVSPERYAALEAMEDAMWEERANRAVEGGFLGAERTAKFIEEKLSGDA